MRTTLLGSAVCALVFLGACSEATDETLEPVTVESTTGDSTNSASPGPEDESTSHAKGTGVDVPVSPTDAIETAKQHAGAGDLTSISLDAERGSYIYEVTLLDDRTEWDIEIDATSGEILAGESDTEDDADPILDITSPLPLDEALDLARTQHDGEITGWTLDSDDGVIEYEVGFADETEVTINVETGQTRVDR